MDLLLTKVIDPIKENFPACTMPLSSTSPTYVTPEIMRCQQCAREYLEHVALIRELLDQSSLSTNSTLLSLSSNRLFQGLSGLLNGASNCTLTREPIPVWNLVCVLRMQANAELVQKTTVLMDGKSGISINMPCSPMPVPEGDAPAFMRKSSHIVDWKPTLLREGRSYTSPDKERALLEGSSCSYPQCSVEV